MSTNTQENKIDIKDIRFSFIIPFYNCSRYIERAIDSILSQPGSDYELILVDDGSSENIEHIALKYVDGGRIRLVRQDNSGPSAARNFGATLARGDYIYYLDCDDELLSGALAIVRQFVSDHHDIQFIVGGHVNSTTDGEKLRSISHLSLDREQNFHRYIRKQLGGFSHGAVIIHRSIMQTFSYPEGISNNEDIVLFAQILASYNAASIDSPLVKIHQRTDSLRRNLYSITRTGTSMVDALFDTNVLPKAFFKYREEFYLSRCLSIFRTLYIAGYKKEAKMAYLNVLRNNPRVLLRWSYTSKFIKLLLAR